MGIALIIQIKNLSFDLRLNGAVAINLSGGFVLLYGYSLDVLLFLSIGYCTMRGFIMLVSLNSLELTTLKE